MKENHYKYSTQSLFNSEVGNSITALLKSWYFYIGLISVIAGRQLNYASETFLYNYLKDGNTLPSLPDLILDNLPYYNVALVYDISSFISVIIVLIYIVHKKDYNRVPFILLMYGIIEILRGIFIILTPLGNPTLFAGSDTLFNGFSKYEQGNYFSGHVGFMFLLLLMVKSRFYKWLLFFCLLAIIISLLFAHSHYSIDIIGGLLFAYAVNSFGNKYLKMFELPSSPK